jgi:23S rRNA G2069 N7-methylase RlmK/C1962 C5-methylase RlmI
VQTSPTFAPQPVTWFWCVDRAAADRPRAVQRSIADHAADDRLRRGRKDVTALLRTRIEAAEAFRESLAIRRDCLPAGAWRGGSAAVADRGSVRRLSGRQTLSQGMDRLLPAIVSILGDVVHPRGILARNDPRARVLEGLEQRVEVLAGDVPEHVEVTEAGVTYDVDLRRGQKTGLFLDQRENRMAAAGYARGGCSTVSAITVDLRWCWDDAPARTIAIDVSEDAIARVTENAARNGVAVETRVGNVFDELRGLERLRERFDTIVLDPPAFAKEQARRRERPGRLQGNQPSRVEALEPGRHARDLQLFV